MLSNEITADLGFDLSFTTFTGTKIGARFIAIIAVVTLSSSTQSKPMNVLANDRNDEWAHATALIRAGNIRDGVRALDSAYFMTVRSNETNTRRAIDEANILENEINPLRRIGNVLRLKRILLAFARLADFHSQPKASSLPVMNTTPQRFALERKLFDSELSSSWLILPATAADIDKALSYGALARFPRALAALGSKKIWTDPGDQLEFYWYYRGWIYAAEQQQCDSINAFFESIATHTAMPEGQYFSAQVSAAEHLGRLAPRELKECAKNG